MSFCLSRCPPTTRTKRRQVPQRKHHAATHSKPFVADSSKGNCSTGSVESTTKDVTADSTYVASKGLGDEAFTSKVPIPSFSHPPLHSFSFSDDEEDPFLKSIRPPPSPRARKLPCKSSIHIPSFALPTTTTPALDEHLQQPSSSLPAEEATTLDTTVPNNNNNSNSYSTETSIQSFFQQHVDPLFLQADNDQWTVKQFLKKTQSRIQRPLTAHEKQCVRKRLKELVNGRVVPQTECTTTKAATMDQPSSIENVEEEKELSEMCAPELDEVERMCSSPQECNSEYPNDSFDGKPTSSMEASDYLEDKESKIVGDQTESMKKPWYDCDSNGIAPTDSSRDSSGSSPLHPPTLNEQEVSVEESTATERRNCTLRNESISSRREDKGTLATSKNTPTSAVIEGMAMMTAVIRETKAPLPSNPTTDDHHLQTHAVDRSIAQKMKYEKPEAEVAILQQQIETPLVPVVDPNPKEVSGRGNVEVGTSDSSMSKPENGLLSQASKKAQAPPTDNLEQHVRSHESGLTNSVPVHPSAMDVDKENIQDQGSNQCAKPKRHSCTKRSKVPAAAPAIVPNLPSLAPAAKPHNQEIKPAASKRRQHTTKSSKGEPKPQNLAVEKTEIAPLPDTKSHDPVSASAVESLDKTEVTPIVVSKPTRGRPATKPPEPPTQKTTTTTTRKRARKGSCALCLTCPCLKPLGSSGAEENIFNQNTFSRSDAAMEKAYLRRIQKLEKTCEHYEGQVEVVRRKLKQHRRDMWKRHGPDHKDPKGGGQKKKTNYFLPDVKELEASASLHPDAIPPELVGTACRAIFPDTPCIQPTLTQFLGVRSKKTEENQSDEAGSDLENEADEDLPEMDIDDRKDGAMVDVTNEHTEYVASPRGDVAKGRVRRVEWHATVLDCDDDKKGSIAPIWKSLVAFEQASPDLEVTTKTPSTNDVNTVLETNSSEATLPTRQGGGIDELAGLFDEFPEESNPSYDKNPEVSTAIIVRTCPSVEATMESTKVDLAMLSPRGRKEACEMIDTIERDPQKLSLLSRGCPEWKENMAFAMYQQDPVAIGQALDNVMEKRNALLDWQRRMMESFQAQKEALNVLEEGLKRSLGRLDQGGFLSQAVVIGEMQEDNVEVGDDDVLSIIME
eukprot:Nitzschia sp. Nitz4//scaffold153_size53422//23345//26810//NITZ4_006762-RA/size53422-augustus-gene-0.49-mRNA-1//-1//CDS//3329537265//4706//frame0